MSGAFEIRAHVICDLRIQKFSRGLVPACFQPALIVASAQFWFNERIRWKPISTFCALLTGGFDECRVCLSWRQGCPLVVISRVTLEGIKVSTLFWHLVLGPVIGGQAYRVPPLTTKAWEERTNLFEERTGRVWPNAELRERAKCARRFFRQFWQSFADELENAIQTKAELSSATATMDKIGEWEEENSVGSRFAASMWIYTKVVICNGQNNMQEYRRHKFRSIMEAVNWVCDDALDDRVWVSERAISCQEAKGLQYDLANPCIVQWCMLWFSAPTNLNRRLLNNGVILQKIQ